MEATSSDRRLQFWGGILVSLLCLAAIFLFVDPREIWHELQNARYDYLALAALGLVVFMFLRAIRWQFLLNSGRQVHSRVDYGPVFHIQNIGYMLTNLLPFRLGDVARAVLIGNVPPVTLSQGISTMVIERVFDLLFMVILFPFTLASIGELPQNVATAVRLLGFAAMGATLLLIAAANQRSLARRLLGAVLQKLPLRRPQRWVQRADDLLAGLSSLTRLSDGLILILLSIVVWLPIIGAYYLGMHAVHLQPNLIEAAFVVCIAAFSVAAPSSPGQLGVFEASVTLAVATILGRPEAPASSFAFLYHAINYLIMGILGVIGIQRTGSTLASVIAATRKLAQSPSKEDNLNQENSLSQ